jgi:SAM-dependent methyltransferase
MYETSKAVQRRLHDPNFISRYFKGRGIDIGAGNDPLPAYGELFPLMGGCLAWDKENGDAELMEGCVEGEFDFVHASHVLEDMRNPQAALARWFTLVKPGGHLILTVPDEDMYEQGVFPSQFNADHKWTFTIYKERSWNERSRNLLGLISLLGPAADLIKIEQLTGTYRFGLPRQDQTRTPIGEAAIEIIIRKRPLDEQAAAGRIRDFRSLAMDALPSSKEIQSRFRPKIALHRPGAYGDIIMTLALVPLLKQKYPDHEIHYYCNAGIGKQLAGLMQAAGVNAVADCTLMNRERMKEYRQTINLIGYPLAEGYPEKPMSEHLIRYFAEEMGLGLRSAVVDAGINNLIPHLTLARPPRPEGLPERYATIHPQAGWSVYKQWRGTRWSDVIAECPHIQFYQIGAADDARVFGADHSFMGKPFYDSIALLANAYLHLGVDTWTNHLTNIEWETTLEPENLIHRYFVPSIILWGSTQWQAAGYGRNTNISLGLPCQPCFREDPKISRMPRGPCINPPGQVYEKPMHACMDGITVDRVLAEIEKLWPR